MVGEFVRFSLLADARLWRLAAEPFHSRMSWVFSLPTL